MHKIRLPGIELDDVEPVIREGEIIERDLEAGPYPKSISPGYTETKGEPLHVVCSVSAETKVVTLYFPDEDRWSRDRFRRRKR